MLATKPWRSEVEVYRAKIKPFAFKRFQEMHDVFMTKMDQGASPYSRYYLQIKNKVQNIQQDDLLLGGCFKGSQPQVHAFYQDILLGLDKLNLLTILEREIADIDIDAKDVVMNQCTEKITMLNEAMERSRIKARPIGLCR